MDNEGKIKVLIVNTVPTELSGITKAIFSFVKYAHSRDIDFDYLSINEIPDYLINDCNDFFKKIYICPRNHNPIKYYKKLKKIIKSERYDIVHAHGNSHTLAIEMLAAKKAKCKVRIAHGQNSNCKHSFIHKLLTPLFRHSYNVGLACSEYAGQFLFGKLPHKVVYNGIDIEQFRFNEELRTKRRTDLNIPQGSIVLGNVARLVEEKNHTFLIDVLSGLLKVDDRYRLLLLGDGPCRSDIEDKINERNLRDYVYLVGNDESKKYLSAMDIILMPSIFEGLPISLIEEQANGLQCLVSDTVTRQVNIGNVSFLSINEGTEIWKEKILSISMPDRLNEAQKSFELAEKSMFNIVTSTNQLIDLYRNSIANIDNC